MMNSRYMRRKTTFIVLMLVMVMIVGSGCAANKTVGEVNGTKITRGALDKYTNVLRLFMPDIEPMLASEEARPQLEGQILDAMVENELLKQLLKQKGLTVSEAEITTFYESQKPDLLMLAGGTEATFAAKLNELKLKEADLKDFLGGSVYVDKLITAQKETLTEEDVKAYITQNPNMGVTLELSHILLATEAEAIAAKARVTAGEDFGAVAKAVSIDPSAAQNSGYLDKVPADATDFDPDFMVGANALAKGEVSQPVQSSFGWHIILLKDRIVPTEEEKAQLTEQAKARLAEERLFAEFDEFKEGADIKTTLS